MLLKDKVVIISGVGPGMGQSMAKIAAREGAKVGLGARNQDYLDQVSKDIAEQGGEVVAVSTDEFNEKYLLKSNLAWARDSFLEITKQKLRA